MLRVLLRAIPFILFLARLRAEPAQPGLETLLDGPIAELRGKRVGVVCNQTAVDAKGRHLVDLLLREPGVTLAAIFTPEHGYRGDNPDGGDPPGARDPLAGVPVFSLYGGETKPTSDVLRGLDVILYDIQDVGARFYTYIATLGLTMQAAAAHRVAFWVLDRPDPITGAAVGGPTLEPAFGSFVGPYPIPIRYGLTAGELALMAAGERWIDLPAGFSPRVIPLRGWNRRQWMDEAGLPWVPPSPDMLTLATAALYPGTCLFEGTNVSEGRGTERPFEWIGAPWIDGAALAGELRRRAIPGVDFAAVDFVPRVIPGRTAAVKYREVACHGVEIRVTDRDRLDPVAVAVHVLHAIRGLSGGLFQWRVPGIDELYGSDRLRRDLDAGRSPQEIMAGWRPGLADFARARERYLLYR